MINRHQAMSENIHRAKLSLSSATDDDTGSSPPTHEIRSLRVVKQLESDMMLLRRNGRTYCRISSLGLDCETPSLFFGAMVTRPDDHFSHLWRNVECPMLLQVALRDPRLLESTTILLLSTSSTSCLITVWVSTTVMSQGFHY